MKKKIQKIAMAVLAVVTINTVNAQSTAPQLKHISTIDNQPVFELQLNNNDNDVYYIAVKDLAGAILHRERITEKKAVRNYALDNDAFSVTSTLIFDIQSSKNKNNTLFEVTNNNRFVSDIEIVTPVK